MGSSPKRSEERSEEWYDEQLKRLEHEKQQILKDSAFQISNLYPNLEEQKKYRIGYAKRYRDLMLNNIYNQYKSEIEQAWNEFEKGKRKLQSTMLDMGVERRHKIDVLRHYAAVKTIMNHSKQNSKASSHHNQSHLPLTSTTSTMIVKKRKSNNIHASGSSSAHHKGSHSTISQIIKYNNRLPTQLNYFIQVLQNHGLFRVSLTPDEVNLDLERIFQSIDSTLLASNNNNNSNSNNRLKLKLNKINKYYNNNGIVGFGGGGYGIVSMNHLLEYNNSSNLTKDLGRQPITIHKNQSNNTKSNNAPNHMLPDNNNGGSKLDKVHISKGILHYHEVNFEKGDKIAVFYTRPKPSLRYEGVLTSINSKEITVRSTSHNNISNNNPSNATTHRVLLSYLSSGKYLLKQLAS